MTLLHHVSIINRNAEDAFHFYRNILGLDLTMKTVNQDDHRMYHLFFGDNEGRVGSEVTIFEITKGPDKKFGTNDIERLYSKFLQSTVSISGLHVLTHLTYAIMELNVSQIETSSVSKARIIRGLDLLLCTKVSR